MSNIIPIDQVRSLANSATKSGMFGIKNADQAFTLMVIAQAENLHPIQAMQMYDVIQGKPALKSTEVLSRFQKSGGRVKWIETSATKAKALFTHPEAGEVEHEYTIEDAKLAGLTGKDNWKQRPKEMLRARCVSSGVRMLYPSCLNNMYSVEEVMDIEPVCNIDDAEIIEDNEIIEEKPTTEDLKRSLATKLKKDFGYTNAMIKEFAEINNLAENVELLEELVSNNDKLTTYITVFEKGE